MKRTVFASAFACSMTFLAGGASRAQEVAPFSFNFGAGFTTPVRTAELIWKVVQRRRVGAE